MENNSNAEIDLWEVLGNFYKLFKKRKGLILSCFALGALFGFGNLLVCPLEYKSYYKKEFIAQSSVTSNEILYDIINNAPIATTFPDLKKLKAKLEANTLKETRLKITIEVFDTAGHDSVINALVQYVNSVTDFKEKFTLQQQKQQQLLGIVKKQIAALDTVGKKTVDMAYIKAVEKKQSIEQNLAYNKIITIIPLNPESIFISNTRATVLMVLGYSFLGLVIGFLIGYAKDLIQK